MSKRNNILAAYYVGALGTEILSPTYFEINPFYCIVFSDYHDLSGAVKLFLFQGTRGGRGKRGHAGPRGVKGEPGHLGPSGVPGEPGSQGAIGQPGFMGITGSQVCLFYVSRFFYRYVCFFYIIYIFFIFTFSIFIRFFNLL